MKRIVFALIFTLFSFFNLLSQDRISLQINGGILYPQHASNGLILKAQMNYKISKSFSFYLYSGINQWDKFIIKLRGQAEYNGSNYTRIFDSYSSDNHFMIPVYLGSKFIFNTNKLFSSYLNLELGYSYLTYNSYDQLILENIETGFIKNYIPDLNSIKKIRDSLIGLGAGAGISHPLSNRIDLLFAFQLNSFINKRYEGFFSNEGTYTAFTLGINYNI